MTTLSKLDELNLKTDRELNQLALNKLDAGIRAALEALTSSDNAVCAHHRHRAAVTAFNDAARMVILLNGSEERAVESKLARLGKMLQVLSGQSAAAIPSQEAVADFARAMWEARGCPQGVPEEDWFRAERAVKARTEMAACATC
jgi:hypothetical protein